MPLFRKNLTGKSQLRVRGQRTDRLQKFKAQKFATDEDGAIVGFAIFLFVMIIIIGGIGIDVMRSEMKRTRMQHTLDRAILAAADLNQESDPETVVRDYFEKSGMTDYLASVTVDEGLNYRVVEANAELNMKTHFMHLLGIDSVSVPAKGRAEERIGGVEISLILDVSGSMNSNSRLTNLKVAAKDFVETMVDNTEDGKLSISIVPYATQVSVPEEVFEVMNVTIGGTGYGSIVPGEDPDPALAIAGDMLLSHSQCINFSNSDYYTTELDPSATHIQTMHFDPWNDDDGRDNDPMNLVPSPVCEDDESREVLLLEKDEVKLKAFIDNLWGGGNTSIDIGMKWGAALLDGSMRPVVDHLISENMISNDFQERPHLYTDGESLKIIVLMTDGQNTSQYYINDDFRTGDSNIWWNDEQEVYSVYVGLDDDDEDNDGVTEEPLFYWPLDDSWQDHAYGEGTYEDTEFERVCRSYRRNGSCRRYRTVETTVLVDEPGSAEIVTYGELYAYTTLEWIVEDLYEPWMSDDEAWDDWYYDVRNYVGSSSKNTRTDAICDAAKDEDVVIFTIGFEAPEAGQTVLENCASSAAHYFDVDGLEIQDAFSAIASAIAQLKLTQ